MFKNIILTNSSGRCRIYFGTDLPFLPSSDLVRYFENSFDEHYNNYVRKNMNEIEAFFARKGLQLIYIPFTVDKFNDEETYHYLHPSAAKGKWKTVDNKISSDFLMQYIVAMTRNIHVSQVVSKFSTLHVSSLIWSFAIPPYFFSTRYEISSFASFCCK